MKKFDKGKKAIVEHDDDDIDDVLEWIEHHRMLEEPSQLPILDGSMDRVSNMYHDGNPRITTSMLVDELWQLDSLVPVVRSKLNLAAASFYMQPQPPLGGALEENQKEIGLTGYGPRQTNFSNRTQQDLSSAFYGMNISGMKGTIAQEKNQQLKKQNDLGDRFHLSDDKEALERRSYLNWSAHSTIKNASFQKQYHNVGSPSSPSSNYTLGGYDGNSSSPYIPLIQHNLGNLPYPLAQLYLQSLRSCNNIVSRVGDPRALANSNVQFPEHSNAYHAVVSPIQSPQREIALLGNGPAFDKGQFWRAVYGPAMSNPGRHLEGSHVPNYPHRSVGPLSRGVMGSRNSISIGNLEKMDIVSLLIHQLKNNTNNLFELVDLAGHFVELSKDQYGSRFLQTKLATARPEEMDMFFHEIRPEALTLMLDVFGNYVIQKFFDYGSTHHVRELTDQMTGHVFQFSLEIFSCRVIQKALAVIEVEKRIKLVSELQGHVLQCIRDQNGNHVIQKCIEHVPEDAIQFILSVIFEEIIPLSTHAYGCRIIQRVLENCQSQKTQKILTDEIIQYVTFLADDMYGNYVVQLLLQSGKPQVRSAIIKNLTGQIVHMSTLKYASNVVEKCLIYCTLEERKRLVDEMLDLSDDHDALKLMAKDQYGNYVVQIVLKTCNEEQVEQILDRIKVHIDELRMYQYAKQIVASLEKLVFTGERRHHILNPA